MAVWNCGTFEIDCIKNTIELGSECYPCICEIVDFWWPDDAPNCFKKEIQKITINFDEDESTNLNYKHITMISVCSKSLTNMLPKYIILSYNKY